MANYTDEPSIDGTTNLAASLSAGEGSGTALETTEEERLKVARMIADQSVRSVELDADWIGRLLRDFNHLLALSAKAREEEEREACAKIAGDRLAKAAASNDPFDAGYRLACELIIEDIRARSKP